ncbi:hypothetical protein BPO_p0115 (plasmid) [Bergeyella porcorum]|uniref:Antitoxin n=1 Tax=Bergeyella porcorum TaxID=1735111 RepID=A0AAU0F714_9FLAO
MNTIYLQDDISLEKYQEAVKALNSIGIKVIEKHFTDAQMAKIKKGIEQIKEGKSKSYLEVRKKAREICGI